MRGRTKATKSFVRLAQGAQYLGVTDDCLPSRGSDHQAFREMGVKFEEVHESDPLYRRVSLPDRWSIEVAHEGKRYDLLDGSGRVRGKIICSVDGANRRAEIIPVRFYDHFVRSEGSDGRRAVATKLGHAVYKTKVFRGEDIKQLERLCTDDVIRWLDKARSGWRSYKAYW